MSSTNAAPFIDPQISLSVSSDIEKLPSEGSNAFSVHGYEDIKYTASVSDGVSDITSMSSASWDFSGEKKSGMQVNHNFRNLGWHNIKLEITVKDSSGNSFTKAATYKVKVIRRETTPNTGTGTTTVTKPELSVILSNFKALPNYGSKAAQVNLNEKLTLTAFVSGTHADTATFNRVSWNFGDGTTGSGKSTTHTYKKTGWYTLKLSASGTNNNEYYTSENTYRIYVVKQQAASSTPELSVVLSNFQPLPKYGNKTAQVNLNEKLSMNAFISGIFSNKAKLTKVSWNFSDGKIGSGKTITHKFKKTGWYTLSLTASSTYNKKTYKSTNSYNIYVVKKPDLYVSSVMKNYDKKKNTASITATIKNKGSLTSKATYIKAYYNSKSLSKYRKVGKIKALKSGESTKITLNFKIPTKYKNLVKNIQVDPTNRVSESVKTNNKFQFK